MMRAKSKVTRLVRGWIGYVGAGAMALGCDTANSIDNAGAPDEVESVEKNLLAVPSTPASVDTVSSSRLPVPVLAWQPCGDDYPGVECAVATVPLDYDHPRQASTTIALARVPATDKAGRIGTVFVNPGGPGGSGVNFMLFEGFGEWFGQLLGGRFDIVSFDPRGVGASEPLVCFDSEEKRMAFPEVVPLFPYRPIHERPVFDAVRSIGKLCLERHSRILPHMNTADVARDLDLLRQAVGDQALTYVGFSYGSMLGTTYANLFPKKVRALVIDGVLDPKLWVSGREIVLSRVSTAREFAEFLRLCDEAGSDCALSGPQGASARFDALEAALKRAPIVLPDGTVYRYDLLILDALAAMYQPETWGGEDGYASFFAQLADAVLASPVAGRRALEVKSTIQARWKQASLGGESIDNSVEGFYGTMCGDAQYPRSFSDWRATGQFAAEGSVFGPYWWWLNAGCADWPMSQGRYAGPWTARTSAPVLIIGNYFDGVTDYSGAVTTSKLLPNSRLLSYAGWGHCALSRSSCAVDYTVAYLVDGKLPPEGTVCPANPNPFIPMLTAKSMARPNPAALIGSPPPWLRAW
jgi:pimeloyl-ACP methyl ester carboxylesterase